MSWVRYWYAYTDVQRIHATHDYGSELAALSRDLIELGEEENAWPHYVRASALIVEGPAGLDRADLQMWPGDLPSVDVRALRTWISDNERAIAEFELGTQKVYCLRDYTIAPFREIVEVPFLRKGLTLTSLLLARAKTNQIEDRLPQVISDLYTCYQFAEQLVGPRPINELLVGVNVRINTTRAAMQIAAHGRSEVACLRELHGLSQARTVHGPALIDFAGERIVVHQYVQGVFTDDGAGEGHIPLNVIARLMTLPSYSRHDVRAWTKLSRRRTVRQADELFAYFDGVKGCTPFELYGVGRSMHARAREIASDNALLLVNVDKLVGAYLRAYRARAMEDGLAVTIAILQFSLTHGHPPDALTSLVREGYLEFLPVDPFSGSPFKYKRIGDDFLLYSLGSDFDDDGGMSNDQDNNPIEGDYVLWPVGSVLSGE